MAKRSAGACRSASPRLLRSGGALGIAWNTLVAPRAEVASILAGAGLEPIESGPYRHFRHRVDQAIVRDVLIARKPSSSRSAIGAAARPAHR